MSGKIGVTCRNCGQRIPIDDEYVPGIHGAGVAASLYRPAAERTLDFTSKTWRKTLTCHNAGCGQAHEYSGGDLVHYND